MAIKVESQSALIELLKLSATEIRELLLEIWPPLMDEFEAARYFNISVQWLRQDRYGRATIPWIEVGGAPGSDGRRKAFIRYRRTDLDRTVEGWRRGGATQETPAPGSGRRRAGRPRKRSMVPNEV